VRSTVLRAQRENTPAASFISVLLSTGTFRQHEVFPVCSFRQVLCVVRV